MGLLPIIGSDDEGCTAHHWGEYTTDWYHSEVSTGSVRAPSSPDRLPVLYIDVQESAQCQHEGCHAKDVRSGKNKHVPMNAVVDTVDINDLEALYDMLDEYWKGKDEE
jgi:hypothetical protein